MEQQGGISLSSSGERFWYPPGSGESAAPESLGAWWAGQGYRPIQNLPSGSVNLMPPVAPVEGLLR